MLEVTVVTGLSGAGRSTALHVLEDLGFFCVDNLPPALAPKLIELIGQGDELQRIALGVDVRTGAFLEHTDEVIEVLTKSGCMVEVLFLDCSDEALVRRFSATRRPHPLAKSGSVLEGIQAERARLGFLRARADRVVDTTDRTVHDLRSLLVSHVAQRGAAPRMITRIVSFGFKYGLPVDADLVFDLRYLPNPHFVPALRPLTGEQEQVAQFVLGSSEGQDLFAKISDLLTTLLPKYEREGKAYLTVALGCTGGRHRSVALAEALASRFEGERAVAIFHRDILRG